MPFLDKFKLKNGMPWKDGFLQGLKGSKCFVSLISRGALALCRDKSRNHTWDNYLLEIETALRHKQASGNVGYIVPLHIGEMLKVEGRTVLGRFDDFAGGLYADTIEGSAEPSRAAQEKEVAAQAAAAAAAEARVVAGIRAKAEQEAKEIRQKAEREAAATTAAAAAARAKSEQQAQSTKDSAAREAAALKAKAEQDAREVRERAERDAKAKAAGEWVE